jgi:hypothetical protein
LALVLAAAASSACRQAIDGDKYYGAPAAVSSAASDGGVTGGEEAGRDATSTDATMEAASCGMPYGAGTCGSCAATSCCTELAACALSPACSAYEACLGGCNGDAGCWAQCTIDHPVGQSPEVSELSACLASNCETTCGLLCGAVAGYVADPQRAGECQSCIEGNACVDARHLGISVDGDAYWRCVLANSTEDLRQLCAIEHPAGAALFASFKSDWSGKCSKDCGYGSYWSCVTSANNVGWPIADGGMVTTTFRVVYFVPNSGTSSSLSPVEGASVAVCTGCPCGDGRMPTPLDQSTTDDAGIVTLKYANQLDLGHGLNGCFDVTAPDIAELYVYWDYPVTVGADDSMDPTDYINALRTTDVPQLLLDEGVDAASLVEDLATRGEVAAVVKDCLGNPAPGVTLSIDTSDPATRVFYGRDLSSGAMATDIDGTGGFYNVPPGTHVITAQPANLAQPSNRFQVYVNPGVVTETQIYPMP